MLGGESHVGRVLDICHLSPTSSFGLRVRCRAVALTLGGLPIRVSGGYWGYHITGEEEGIAEEKHAVTVAVVPPNLTCS